MAHDKVKFNLRLPADLYAKIARSASESVPEMSINQEIVRRLATTFDLEELDWGGVDVRDILDGLEAQIAKTKGKARRK